MQATKLLLMPSVLIWMMWKMLCNMSAIYRHMDYFITRDKELLQSGIPILPVNTPEDFFKEVIML